MTLGIDASTPGSGGARRHLLEILKCFNPTEDSFEKIKIWGVKRNLDQIPDYPWLEKISHPYLNKNFFYRTWWQIFIRSRTFQKSEIDVLFSPFGTFTGSFRPYATMSRNMLIFDVNEQRRFGWSWWRLKLMILNFTQRKSFNKASGLIFISEHAKSVISKVINTSNKKISIIHHGVSSVFRSKPKEQRSFELYDISHPFRLLYVSSIWIYKHPWNVVQAVNNLRAKGYPVILDIVGANEEKKAGDKLYDAIKAVSGNETFVFWHQAVGLDEISSYYKQSDAFVFASTCENMPNILIEAMSSGLPIACSDYAPMPEFLGEGGLYIDPLNIADIEKKLEKLLLDVKLRQEISDLSYQESFKYNWQKCAKETFAFLATLTNHN
ncbi:glycosyltransferase family 4 protein [Aquirufa sp. Wall-65K1]